ncbi:MAG: hypothetical protein OEW68_08835 [Gammaproteobacteria bacterium]|nr:hypothetical protein [Gammaproteobacteria bacterium]MDH4314932.1 hypothetical protein [Gammaproteobacteria bacterium]MDH5214187.1 hypothetical protein [Gammaproteobacteria bacterium]
MRASNLSSLISLLVVLSFSGLTACSSSAWQNVAESEKFSFRYVLLPPDPLGDYVVRIRTPNGLCQPVRLSDSEMHNMFTTGSHTFNNITIPFDFDLLTPCNSDRYVLNDQDLESIRNAPLSFADAEAERHDGSSSTPGFVDIRIGSIQVIAYSQANGPLVPGPMRPDPARSDSIFIPSNTVGASGDGFSPLNGPAGTQYFEFELLSMPSNPDRITADFAFVARQPTGNSRLIVWDADVVLQDH